LFWSVPCCSRVDCLLVHSNCIMFGHRSSSYSAFTASQLMPTLVSRVALALRRRQESRQQSKVQHSSTSRDDVPLLPEHPQDVPSASTLSSVHSAWQQVQSLGFGPPIGRTKNTQQMAEEALAQADSQASLVSSLPSSASAYNAWHHTLRSTLPGAEWTPSEDSPADEEWASLADAILASQVTAKEEDKLRGLIQRQLAEVLQVPQAGSVAGAAPCAPSGAPLSPCMVIGEEELSAALATLQATLLGEAGSPGEDGQRAAVPQGGPISFDLATREVTQRSAVWPISPAQASMDAGGAGGMDGVKDDGALDALEHWWGEADEAAEAVPALCRTCVLVEEGAPKCRADSRIGGA